MIHFFNLFYSPKPEKVRVFQNGCNDFITNEFLTDLKKTCKCCKVLLNLFNVNIPGNKFLIALRSPDKNGSDGSCKNKVIHQMHFESYGVTGCLLFTQTT